MERAWIGSRRCVSSSGSLSAGASPGPPTISGLPRSSVTDAVKGLEARLGIRLLQRSTRHVSPTLDGEAYYRRCVNLISDLEDAEAGFTGVKPSGLVRIDVHGTQARHFLLPGLPRFLDAYPD